MIFLISPVPPNTLTMSQNTQEKEFAVFGIINNRLKAGLIIGLLTLSLGTNAIQFNIQLRTNDRIVAMQADLYKQMLDRVDRTVNERLQQPVSQIKKTLKRVDNSLDVVDSVADRANTATRKFENKLKKNK